MKRFPEVAITAAVVLGVLLAMILIFVLGCDDRDECTKVGEVRCVGTEVEICNGGHWSFREDCAEVWLADGSKAEWKCCAGTCMESCDAE